MDWFILNRRGRPMRTDDAREWVQAKETDPRWTVAEAAWESRGGWVRVSTTFLGFDPRPKSERYDGPVLWESVALYYADDESAPERLSQVFYRSRFVAARGHQRLVRSMQEGDIDETRSNGRH